MYEMNKQFEIKNEWENEVYIKYLEKNGGIFLAIISPQKDEMGVVINKFQTHTYTSMVEKINYKKSPEYVIGMQKFLSTYTQKEYTTR